MITDFLCTLYYAFLHYNVPKDRKVLLKKNILLLHGMVYMQKVHIELLLIH